MTLEQFEESYIPEPNSGCWLWLRHVNGWGYGSCTWVEASGRRTRTAHLASWLLYRGFVSKRDRVDHKCRVRCCVNPDHLEPVSHRENILRGTSPWGGRLVKKTRCPRGHEYNTENTILNRMPHNGFYTRACRICKKENARLRYQAKRKP